MGAPPILGFGMPTQLGALSAAGVAPTVQTPGMFDPVTAHNQLLTKREGYFLQAGGNGGQGGVRLSMPRTSTMLVLAPCAIL